MARLPPLERGVGADRLARWHATLGRLLCWVISGHVLFIIWGYAVAAHDECGQRDGTLLTTYPDVLMATVGWFLLLGVAGSRRCGPRAAGCATRPGTTCTSTPTWRSRWRSATSSPTAPPSSTTPSARFAWSALYVVAAALIVWYRVILPPAISRRHRFTVPGYAQRRTGIVSVYVERTAARPNCAPRPASSSAGGSLPASCGGSRTRTRCRRCRADLLRITVSPRRPERHAALAQARHPGARRGAVRRLLPRRSAGRSACC